MGQEVRGTLRKGARAGNLKQLVIAGGKGGTGKTTLATSFLALSGSGVLVDCDVDAPNAHLLLGSVTDEQVVGTVEGYVARIDETACTRCGTCEEACFFYAIQEFRVEEVFCRGCAVCTMACPVGAISMAERKVGDVRVARTDYGPLVWGELAYGEAGTGKFINALRDVGGEVALRESSELIFVDASAGIGCPLISSITGADLMLAVAEPTVSGKSDLERALRVARHFGVRALVCVNRYDLHEPKAKEVERMAREVGAEPVGRIPYDPEVVKAVVEGMPVVAVSDGPAAGAIREVFGRVMERLFE